MQAWPTSGSLSGGSWSFSRPATSVQGGSQVRSWSQSSQGRRHEALAGLGAGAPTTAKPVEREAARSPRPQTSRRALSYTQLQMASSIGQTNGASKGPVVQPESTDEAQMNSLRHSLLQHIQSVQKEISRLQVERQRNQQGFSESRGQRLQLDGSDISGTTRANPGGDCVSPSGVSSTATSLLLTASPTPTRTGTAATVLAHPSQSNGQIRQPALRSPQAATRGFSCERLSGEQTSDIWRQPVSLLQRDHQAVSSLQGSLLAPAAALTSSASVSVPVVSSNRLTSKFSSGSVALRIPDRSDGQVRGVSPTKFEALSLGEGPRRGPSPPRLAVVRGASADRNITRTSLGKPATLVAVRADRSPVGDSAAVDGGGASEATGNSAEIVTPLVATVAKAEEVERGGNAGDKRPFGKFTHPGVHLAATRIQRAWKLQSWRRKFVTYSERQCSWVGSLEWLQQHNLLYGTELASAEDVKWWLEQRATAPLDREVDPWGSERLLEHLSRMWYGSRTVEADHQQQLQQQQQLEQQRKQAAARLSHRSERDSLPRQEWNRVEQRSEDIFKAFAAVPQQSSTQPLESTSYNGAKTRGHVVPMLSSGASHTLPLRALPSGGSGGSRQVSMTSPSRNGKDSLRTVSALSPRTEGISSGTPGAPNGDALAARLKGAVVLGAPPPPSMHGYSRSYRVASHSPPQTHRTTRATVPATPMLNSVSRRPMSPVQTGPASGRLSLPHSSSLQMQNRSLGAVQHPSSSMNRALSGSPPPSVVNHSPLASRR